MPFGITTALADPQIEVLKTGNPNVMIAANDNWGNNPATSAADLASAFARVGAFPLIADSRDAALVSPFTAGVYTASVNITGSPGLVLAEIYDSAPAIGPRLVNLSARNHVGSGGDVGSAPRRAHRHHRGRRGRSLLHPRGRR